MTRIQRLENIIIAVLLLLAATALFVLPDKGYILIFIFVALSGLFQSVKLIIYYFTMARFMVGGRRVLLRAVICFDLAAVTLSFTVIPEIYVMIYLVGGMIFLNGIDIFKAIEARKYGSSHWVGGMVAGIGGVVFAVVCLINYQSPVLAGYIFAAELIYAAGVRLVECFRRTEVVYIQ